MDFEIEIICTATILFKIIEHILKIIWMQNAISFVLIKCFYFIFFD